MFMSNVAFDMNVEMSEVAQTMKEYKKIESSRELFFTMDALKRYLSFRYRTVEKLEALPVGEKFVYKCCSIKRMSKLLYTVHLNF